MINDSLGSDFSRLIVEQMSDGVCVARLSDNRFIYLNAACLRIIGYEHQDLHLQPVHTVQIELSSQEQEAFKQEVLSTSKLGKRGKFLSREARVFRKDGTPVWCRLQLTAAHHPEHGALLIGILKDISDEKKIYEERLARSERWFRTAVESMPDAFGIFTAIRDAGGSIVDFSTDYLNNAAARYNFSERDQWSSKRRFDLLPFHREIGLFEEYCQVVETGKPLIRESFTHETVDGKRRLARAFDIRATKLGDGFAVTWGDITERKRIEETIVEQQKMMIYASKMSALGEMASGVAHEINNPLAVIHGTAEILLEEATKGRLDLAEVRRAAEKIESTAMRIHQIVSGLRSFARDGSGDSFMTVSLRTIVDDTLSFCKERFKNHAIRLEVDSISPKLTIDCRPTQISQVLLNLLNNAHDAVESLESRWVRIGFTEQEQRVRLTITDSGKGIPAEIQDKILQPFFTTKPEGQGTGLGLSISKGIVETHSGTLSLDPNQPNTCFVVELPKRRVAP